MKTQIEARIKAGDTMEVAAATSATSASVKIEAKSLAAFSLRNRPQDADSTVLGALDRLEKGQLSEMLIAQDKGVFVYATDKVAPDLTETNPQFVPTRLQIAGYTARLTAGAYISELVEQELKKSEPKTP